MAKALLYDYFRSSASYRVRIALNLKGVKYEQRPINLAEGAQRKKDFKALNPQGFVPMLEIDGHKLTQSLSIIVYLDQKYPEPKLMPADPTDAAHVRSLALTVACDIHALGMLLYELLAGRLPFAFGNMTPGEIETAIRQLPPPPMTSRVGDGDLVLATAREYQKLGQPITPREFGHGFYDLLKAESLVGTTATAG